MNGENPNSLKGKNIYVGLSGGVDSSVSAALLKELGANITGVFIKVWHPEFLECTWKEDREDAMRVCAHLEIPFKEYDFQDEYKKYVVDYMIAEYKAGRTPNPDVMCNKHVKFDAFLNRALTEGADFIATGHYAIAKHCGEHSELHAGIDNSKDQSYFLWTLKRDVLKHVLFPVGGMLKSDVRKHAERFGLLTAKKKDSQGLCFLGHVDIKEFLAHFLVLERGDVLSKEGEIIGFHEGSLALTIGQRHGFTITRKTPNDEPYFILEKDVENNTITVAYESEAEVLLKSLTTFLLRDENWIEDIEAKEYGARIRYRAALSQCTLEKTEEGTVIRFLDSPHAPALGQSVVVYDASKVIGGGILDKIL